MPGRINVGARETVRQMVMGLLERPHGEWVLTYDSLERNLGYDVREVGRHAVYAVRDELEEHYGRTLIAENGVGYRLSQYAENAVVAKERLNRGMNTVQRGHTLLAGTPTDKMTDDQLSHHNHMLDLLEEFNTLRTAGPTYEKASAYLTRLFIDQEPGPKSVFEIRKASLAEGITWNAMRIARSNLGIIERWNESMDAWAWWNEDEYNRFMKLRDKWGSGGSPRVVA